MISAFLACGENSLPPKTTSGLNLVLSTAAIDRILGASLLQNSSLAFVQGVDSFNLSSALPERRFAIELRIVFTFRNRVESRDFNE